MLFAWCASWRWMSTLLCCWTQFAVLCIQEILDNLCWTLMFCASVHDCRSNHFSAGKCVGVWSWRSSKKEVRSEAEKTKKSYILFIWKQKKNYYLITTLLIWTELSISYRKVHYYILYFIRVQRQIRVAQGFPVIMTRFWGFVLVLQFRVMSFGPGVWGLFWFRLGSAAVTRMVFPPLTVWYWNWFSPSPLRFSMIGSGVFGQLNCSEPTVRRSLLCSSMCTNMFKCLRWITSK